MGTDRHCSVLVVGGGIAGWTAATQALELGAEVMLVERATEPAGYGNTRLSGGYFHAGYLDPRKPAELLYNRAIEVTDGNAAEALAWAWATHCGEALRYLEEHGARFSPAGPAAWMAHVLEPHGLGGGMAGRAGLDWEGRGPDRLLQRLGESFLAHGGTFRGGSRVTALEVEPSKVAVAIESEDGRIDQVTADRVVLCDGGFQADRALMREHIGSDRYFLRGSPNNTGECFKAGCEIGAAASGLRWFYGHLLSRDACRNDRLWPHPTLDDVCEASLVIDGRGAQIGCPGQDFLQLAHAIMRTRSPDSCWVVFDNNYWQGPGREGSARLNPRLQELGGTVVEASTVPELAAAISVPSSSLVTTISRRAETIARRRDPATTSVHHEPPVSAQIESAPFFAAPLVVGITFAMGGLLVDAQARVIGRDGAVIPGLFAAGGTMGGLQGGRRGGYLGGWSEATIFGLIAGRAAAGINERLGTLGSGST